MFNDSNSTLAPPCTSYGQHCFSRFHANIPQLSHNAFQDFSVFGLSYMLPQCLLGNGKPRQTKKPMKSKTWRKVLCLSQGASCLKLKITLSGKGRSNFVRIRFKGFKSPSSLLRFIERLGWNCLWCGPECFQLASLYALTFFF